MLYLIYLQQDHFQVFREEGKIFERRGRIYTDGVEDTVKKIVEVVNGFFRDGAKAVVFRGYIANAMLIRNRKVCVNLKLMCLRCIMSVCFFYAKSCIGLDKVGTLLQTADGQTKFRRGTGALLNLGEGSLSSVDMRRSLDLELTERIDDDRRQVVEEAVSPGGSLELLDALDRALEELRAKNPDFTMVLDNEKYQGGFTSEIRRRIGRKDMQPIYGSIKR